MDEFDSLDNYNGHPVHDMEVDYSYHIKQQAPVFHILLAYAVAESI
ncbi:MAG: hypothetical protein K2H60_12355 [Muribaculaceae bacterium]|nr:hypothetical protein [Muribaculaceae bacterium]